MSGDVTLRETVASDLDTLFEHQRDPVANAMAAFPPRDREAFMTLWADIFEDDEVISRTILRDGEIAGSVGCFQRNGEWLVGYWIGREFWGRGTASAAVAEFVSSIDIRPLRAYVAKSNVASIRVLEKSGFEVSGESRSAAVTGGEVVDEFVYDLPGRHPAP